MSEAHHPRERLNHLLDLANLGSVGRATLLNELADLLLDWPPNYAPAMRAPFVALLEQTARGVDAATRAALAQRLAGHDELPIALLNEFFLAAPKHIRARILMRNEALAGNSDESQTQADGEALVAAVRTTINGAFAETFAAMLSLPKTTAQEILSDASGQSLAVACKGAGVDRAAFSTVALLAANDSTDPASRLGAYDQVPQRAAQELMRYWRTRA